MRRRYLAGVLGQVPDPLLALAAGDHDAERRRAWLAASQARILRLWALRSEG
jgi:hypothetical protein